MRASSGEGRGAMVVAVGSTGILLLALLYYWWAWGSVCVFAEALDKGDQILQDFVRVYYPAGVWILKAHRPSPGYFYSPFFALCLSVLSRDPLETALWMWGSLQAGAAILLLLVPGVQILSRSRTTWFIYLATFVMCEPVWHCLRWGQVSILLILGIVATMYLYRAGWRGSAAVVLAVVISIKFYPAMFLVYFLFKRDWRFVSICMMAAAGLSFALPVYVLGAGDFFRFCALVADQVRMLHSDLLNHVNSQYLPAVLTRWLYGTVQDAAEQDGFKVISYSIAAINMVLLSWVVWRGRDRIEWAFVLLLATLPLVVETSWPHYFVYLPFCQALICIRLIGAKVTVWNLGKASMVGSSMLLSSVMMLHWMGGWERYSGSGVLLVADLLVLVLVYITMAEMQCAPEGTLVSR